MLCYYCEPCCTYSSEEGTMTNNQQQIIFLTPNLYVQNLYVQNLYVQNLYVQNLYVRVLKAPDMFYVAT